MTLKNKTSSPSSRSLRLNTALLRDPDFIEYFVKELSLHLQNNDHPGIFPMPSMGSWERWAKLSPFYPQKKENAKVVDLEQTIKLLEESHRTLPDEPTLQQIKKAKLQLSEIVN